MSFTGDERAQSVQVGAVLLFGVLIIAFSSYQAFAVPEQNREVEFNHNQQVQTQLQDLRNAIVSVPGQPSQQAVSVHLGTRYPSRLVATNPGPPSGLLYTDGTANESRNLTVRNAEAVNPETADYWNGTASRHYNTGAIAYKPEYNVYDGAPETVYEHSVVYNQFRRANLTLSEQAMVDGRDVTLVALNGSLSRSASDSVTVDVQPKSQSSRTVRVRNATGSNVSVSFLSRLPASQWNETLGEEVDPNPGNMSNDRYVANVIGSEGPGSLYNITLVFERGATYRLQMAKAGVGTGTTDESEAYLTTVDSDSISVARGDSEEIVLEVRDAYNNPVSGATVNGSVEGENTGALTTDSESADNDGRVEFVYETTQSTETGNHTVEFSIDELHGSFDSETPEDVAVPVTVTEASQGPGDGDGSGNNGLIYNEDAVARDSNDGIDGGVEFSVTNELGEEITITTVAVDPVDDDIDYLSDTYANDRDPAPQENELYIEADTDGYTDFGGGTDVPRVIDVDDDSRSLSGPNPVMSDGSIATFHLFEFQDGGWGPDEVDMDGESVTITVTYELSSGGTDSKMFTVTPGGPNANEQPNADFTIDSSGNSNNRDFDASPSSDPQGDIAAYEWDLDGDGIFDDATGQTVRERVPSDTTVALRVVDSEGNADTVRKVVP
ncbi:PKD domain-containing protein [Haloarcula brevis]|uniref:PKD domain-containing protein n=1 Tax=Haloarcula brevis TaxID=3111453 RepID=UPI00300EBA96